MNNATIQEDYTITIPQDIREDLNWKEGDTLIWEIQGDNSIVIRKEHSFFEHKEQAINSYLKDEDFDQGKDHTIS